jgi:hypothetical protein
MTTKFGPPIDRIRNTLLFGMFFGDIGDFSVRKGKQWKGAVGGGGVGEGGGGG